MINVSNEFKKQLAADNRNYLEYADITLKDGTVLNLTNKDLWGGGLSIEDAVSSDSSFDIGAAIINKCTLTINNIYDEFSDYIFEDANVMVYVGLELSSGVIEKIRKGVYTVNEANYNGSIITLECLDNMYKFDRPYSESKLVYPATLGEILRDACSVCGVFLQTASFANDNYIVQNRPENDGTTFREVVSWVAQIACKWAKMDSYGRLTLGWYDESEVTVKNPILTKDGQYIKTQSGISILAKVPAQNQDYISGNVLGNIHGIRTFFSRNISLDDVVITGVKVYESQGEEASAYLCGEEGYVLSIEKNGLIETGKGNEIAELIGNQIIGLSFRPVSLSILSDPTIESGDRAYIVDRKQNIYFTYITNLLFSTGSAQSIKCGAKSPARNSATRYSEAAKTIVESRKEAAKQISSYDLAVQNMNMLAANTLGFYATNVFRPDGSVISYRHDKPTLAESKTVYKSGIDGFWVTTDYQGTDTGTEAAGKWKSGFDSSGNAVLNILSVIGINFSWAKGGELTLGGYNNENGLVKVLNSSGEEIDRIDDSGIQIKASDSILKMRDKGDFGIGIELQKYNGDDDSLLCDIGYDGMSLWKFEPGYENGEEALYHVQDSYYSHDCEIYGDFYVYGEANTKGKIVETTNYSDRIFCCYETPTPMFGDIGGGILDENGICIVAIDEVFSETVTTDIEYQVFIQKEGIGDIWVDSKESAYFIVKGTPNLKFSWEIKCIQRVSGMMRLEEYRKKETEENTYEQDYMKEIENLIKERDELLDETIK